MDEADLDMKPAAEREAALFQTAVQLTGAERAAFLNDACHGDAALRQRLEALLAAHDAEDSLLAEPPTVKGRATIRIDLADDPADVAVGLMIGRYKLLEKIGEGGCGVVYVAEQTEPVRRRVALKVIKLGMDTKQVVARFEAERQALAMMDHPNIAKVLDAGTIGAADSPLSTPNSQLPRGRPYFVMELVRGIRITDYCDQAKLSTQERLGLFIKICHAIQHAHQKGIIHRDIKPSNILVTLHDGVPVPKVIDFGIAKATEGRLTDATVYTELHQFIGTPAYMSPEQAEMSGLDIDTRSDIYSLGVLLYELLAGSTPFDTKVLMASGIDAMRKTIREKEPVRPSTRLATLQGEELTSTAKRRSSDTSKLVHQVKGDLDWIVMKCLEKDRTRRYETANGLAADLKRHLKNEPIVAHPPSTAYRLKKTWRRNKLAFAAAAAVVVALIVGLGLSTWQFLEKSKAYERAAAAEQKAEKARANEASLRQRSEEARANETQLRKQAEAQELISRQQAYAADMNLVQQALALNNLGRAQMLLNRQKPKTSQQDLRGWEWRYLWRQCQSDALFCLGKMAAVIQSLSVSHDGSWVAAGGFVGGQLSVWNLRTRQKISLLDAGRSKVQVAFSPREPLLAFSMAGEVTATNRQFAVALWNAATGQILTNLPLGGVCGKLAFSSDGETLVTATMNPDNKITLWRVRTGEILTNYFLCLGGDEYAITLAVTRDLSVAAYSPTDPLGGFSSKICLIDLATGKERWSARSGDELVASLALSPDGKILASGAFDSVPRIRLWDVASGTQIGRPLEGHRAWVSDFVFWPDGKTLASSSADQTIRLWDLTDPADVSPIRTLRGHKLEVWSLALLPGSNALVSGSKDGEALVWDTASTRREYAGVRLLEKIVDWRFAPDSQSLIALDTQGHATRRKGAEFHEVEALIDVGTNILGSGLSPDGRLAAIGSIKGTVQVWDLERRTLLRDLAVSGGPVWPLGILPQARNLFLLYEDDSSVHEWDLTEWRETKSWRTQQSKSEGKNQGFGFAATPDEQGLLVYYGSWGLLRNATTGGEKIFRHELQGATLSSDGKHCANASNSGFVKLWEAETLREVHTFSRFLLGAHTVAFSPNGKRLAAGSGGPEAIRLWDVESKQELLTLPGQGLIFVKSAFSADGDVLGAMNLQGVLHLWRAPSWEEIAVKEVQE